MTTMSYKGYEAIVEYDKDAEIFHGEACPPPSAWARRARLCPPLLARQPIRSIGKGSPGDRHPIIEPQSGRQPNL